MATSPVWNTPTLRRLTTSQVYWLVPSSLATSSLWWPSSCVTPSCAPNSIPQPRRTIWPKSLAGTARPSVWSAACPWCLSSATAPTTLTSCSTWSASWQRSLTALISQPFRCRCTSPCVWWTLTPVWILSSTSLPARATRGNSWRCSSYRSACPSPAQWGHHLRAPRRMLLMATRSSSTVLIWVQLVRDSQKGEDWGMSERDSCCTEWNKMKDL